MNTDYKNLDFEIYVRLHDLQGILTHYQVEDDYFEMINRHMELIRTKRFRVAVIGEFSRGKSSLLNALLGGRILPADITPTTATINRIAFDKDPRVELNYKDGSVEEIDINELEDYVTKLTEKGEKAAERIEEAVIYYPTVICQNNINLIDTPGLNEDEKMTQLTVQQLKKIDAAVVLVSALSPVDQIEQDLIAALIESPEIECLVFVISFIDCIDPEDQERMIELIRTRILSVGDTLSQKYGPEHEITRKANRILSRLELYAVSSTQALKALETNNRKKLNESHFLEFQKGLYRILASQQQKNALVKTLRLLAGAGERLDDWYGEKNERLEKRLQEARERKKQMEDYLSSLMDETKEIVGKHILPSPEYVSVQELSTKYEGICIAGLSMIAADDEAAIIEGIQSIDMRINRYTAELMQKKQEQLMLHAKQCLEELVADRENRFCQSMSDFSPQEADSRRQAPIEIWQGLKEPSETCNEHYRFFMEYQRPYVLADTALQSRTDFFLIDVRHCDYIVFMKEATKKHAAAVEKWFSGWKTKYVDRLWNLQRKDEGEKEEILALASQWVTDCEDEILVNRKLYDKHREQLSQMEKYAKETINSIQEEEI